MTTINAKKFSRVMREMARVPSRASRDVAKDIDREIQNGFDRGLDPSGRPWRKLARSTLQKGRHNPPLTDTGKGRNSVVVSPTSGAGIRIVIGVLYMIYHQFGGASHLRGPGGSYRLRRKNKNFGRDKDRSSGREQPPKRSFLPFDKIPKAWGEIVLSRLEQHAKSVMRRG